MARYFIAVIFYAISLSSFADPTNIPTKKIVSVVKQYANKVGCFIYMDQKNIVRYEIDGLPYFVVLYHIDTECSGGSSMHRPAFAALSTDNQGRVHIVQKYSDPKLTPDSFPQYIDRIYIKNNQLWYSGRDFNWGVEHEPSKGDALCCPSLHIESIFVFDHKGWVDTRRNTH